MFSIIRNRGNTACCTSLRLPHLPRISMLTLISSQLFLAPSSLFRSARMQSCPDILLLFYDNDIGYQVNWSSFLICCTISPWHHIKSNQTIPWISLLSTADNLSSFICCVNLWLMANFDRSYLIDSHSLAGYPRDSIFCHYCCPLYFVKRPSMGERGGNLPRLSYPTYNNVVKPPRPTSSLFPGGIDGRPEIHHRIIAILMQWAV